MSNFANVQILARERFNAPPPGYPPSMSSAKDDPTLDNVMIPTETVNPDHHEHAKSPKHLNDDELAERAEHEQALVDDAKNGDN